MRAVFSYLKGVESVKVTKEDYHAFLEKELAFLKEQTTVLPEWTYTEIEITMKIMKELYLLDSEELKNAETQS